MWGAPLSWASFSIAQGACVFMWIRNYSPRDRSAATYYSTLSLLQLWEGLLWALDASEVELATPESCTGFNKAMTALLWNTLAMAQTMHWVANLYFCRAAYLVDQETGSIKLRKSGITIALATVTLTWALTILVSSLSSPCTTVVRASTGHDVLMWGGSCEGTWIANVFILLCFPAYWFTEPRFGPLLVWTMVGFSTLNISASHGAPMSALSLTWLAPLVWCLVDPFVIGDEFVYSGMDMTSTPEPLSPWGRWYEGRPRLDKLGRIRYQLDPDLAFIGEGTITPPLMHLLPMYSLWRWRAWFDISTAAQLERSRTDRSREWRRLDALERGRHNKGIGSALRVPLASVELRAMAKRHHARHYQAPDSSDCSSSSSGSSSSGSGSCQSSDADDDYTDRRHPHPKQGPETLVARVASGLSAVEGACATAQATLRSPMAEHIVGQLLHTTGLDKSSSNHRAYSR